MTRLYRPAEGIRFVQANGLRFGYFEWGEGPPVLLLHGFPDTAHTWDLIGPGLAAAGFRVIAPFLRGYAPTEIPARDPDTRVLSEDALALIDAFGGKLRVVGHDWGAEATYGAVGLHPEAFECLVTVAVPHRVTVPLNPKLLWALRHFATLRFVGAEARFARDDFAGVELLCKRWSPTWAPTREALDAVKNAFSAPGCLRAALGYYRAANLRAPPFMRTKISVPSLAVCGQDDPSAPLDLYRRAASQYAGLYRVAPIPGGHFCHRESPDAFLRAVVPFLRDPTAPSEAVYR